MIKLGNTTTGKTHGMKYLWLVKDMEIYRNYSKKECYVVLALKEGGDGWFHMFNGTLKACRNFIGDETIVTI